MGRRIVIVGGGQAGAQVAISLREQGYDGALTLLSDEAYLPYQRPPLSKSFLKDATAPERLFVRPGAYYEAQNIDVRLGTRVAGIDRDLRHVSTAGGDIIPYDQLVLGTGTRARWPDLTANGDAPIFALRQLADVVQMREPLLGSTRIGIVGGGFIGLEVAAVLRDLGRDVVVIEAADRVLQRVTSEPISEYLVTLHRTRGVDLRLGRRVSSLSATADTVTLVLDDGTDITVGALLFAIGAVPNIGLAVAAGLRTDDGIVVDEAGRTSDPAIFATGDCARFPSRRFGGTLRLESVQNAVDQSKAVAQVLSGRPTAYDPVPWFWSDQFDMRLQMAGIATPDCVQEIVGDPSTGRFSVLYRRAGQLVAAHSVNDPKTHLQTRWLLAEPAAPPRAPSSINPGDTGGREQTTEASSKPAADGRSTGVRAMSETVLITPDQLTAMVATGKVVVIDTRDPKSYAAGHIPGAVNLHDIFTYLATSTPEGMTELTKKFAAAFGAAGLSGEETAVIYEQSMATGFGQSCRGYFLLKYLGYPKAKVLHGGLAAWTAGGRPLSTAVPSPMARVFPIDPTAQSLIVDKTTMRAAIDNPAIIKLDVRDVDEWIGESSSPYGKDFCPRKGRLPQARWIEWYRMMKPTAGGQMFKSKAEILAECETVGITADTPVFLYCFKGARASNTFVALKEAGIKDVRIYFGSWNEWSRDPSLPIDGTTAAVAA